MNNTKVDIVRRKVPSQKDLNRVRTETSSEPVSFTFGGDDLESLASEPTPIRTYERLKIQRISNKHYGLFESASLLSNYGIKFFSFIKELDTEDFGKSPLKNHKISNEIRCKMVDWILEIFNVFNFNDTSFFLAVHIMDTYFHKSSRSLNNNDVHLVGIVSMLLASKFEETLPLRVCILSEKIGYNTFSEDEIIMKEREIVRDVGFSNFICTSTFEFIKNFFVDFNENNYEMIEQNNLRKIIDKLEKYATYYSKLILHFIEFYNYKHSDKAIACISCSYDMINEKYSSELSKEGNHYIKEWIRYLIRENNAQGEIQRIYSEIAKYTEIYLKINFINFSLNQSYKKTV